MRHLCWIMLVTVGLVLTFTASAAYATCPLRANDAKAAIATAEKKGEMRRQFRRLRSSSTRGWPYTTPESIMARWTR